jgi:hypothetical protein
VQARRVGGDPDVGGHRQGETRAHRRPVDPGHDRLVGLEPEREKKPSDPALLVEHPLLVRQPGLDRRIVATTQVQARTERVAVAGQRHDPNAVIGAGVADRPHDAPAQ